MQQAPNTSVVSQEVETWGAWASRANNAYIGFLALTLIATVLIVVFNNRLNRAKDASYAREKQASDERIAAANAGAAEARLKAAEANEGLAKSAEKIAGLTAEAETAKKERAEADKQIAIAKADAARAREGIANAEAVSAKAGVEVARLRAVVANAERERAEAQKALIEIQARVNNRIITPDQEVKFLAYVSRFKQRGTIILTAPDGDPEAIAFANQLTSLLTKGGWDVKARSVTLAGKTYFGINLLLRVVGRKVTPDQPLYHAAILAEGFKAAGIEFAATEEKDQDPTQVRMWVGHKFKP
jgi:hypothetical protein